jgi:type III secretion protein N (ATPase)
MIQETLESQIQRLKVAIGQVRTRVPSGKLIGVSGTLIRAELTLTQIGELCELRSPDGGPSLYGEVIALDGPIAFLAPYGSIEGLSPRTEVISLGRGPSVEVGEHILGQVLDGLGEPVSRFSETYQRIPGAVASVRALNMVPPAPLKRQAINKPFAVGIRSMDGFLTCGEGQRLGIFGNAGAGKSTLISQIVADADADILVVGLIGERGREVGDFIRRTIRPDRMDRTVLVVSTSDRPPIERYQAALTATTIAEYFADLGKRVLLVMDSITRLSRALRDIGLAAGEPPTRRGFPPSVFTILPRLLERAGPRRRGSITAFYTVLVEGDAMADPIAEETRSLLDGHIVLSQKLAESGHYPAIDILESRSRVMDHVVSKEHLAAATRLRELVSRYREIELLLQVGEYRSGSDPVADEAVAKINDINAFLRQGADEVSKYSDTVERLLDLVA